MLPQRLFPRCGPGILEVHTAPYCRFRVSLWASKPGGKNFHDRYILTDQCGIDAPGGLDFVTDATRANLSGWRLLEHDEVTDILSREFHERKGPYRHLGTCEVKPKNSKG